MTRTFYKPLIEGDGIALYFAGVCVERLERGTPKLFGLFSMVSMKSPDFPRLRDQSPQHGLRLTVARVRSVRSFVERVSAQTRAGNEFRAQGVKM